MVQERAEALLRLAAEQGFSLWLAVGNIRRDWALVQQGETERRGSGPAAPGAGRLLGFRGRAGTGVLACPLGGGAWDSWTGRRGAGLAQRNVSGGGKKRC